MSSVLVIDRAQRGARRPAGSPSSSTKASSSSTATTRLTSPMARASAALEHVAEQGQLLGLGHAHQPGQQPRGPVVEREAPLGEDHREAGPVRGHHQIAAQRQAQAGPDGEAVDLGDGRFGEPVQGQGHVAHAAHAQEPGLGALGGRAGGVAQVGARAERPAGAGEDHYPVTRCARPPEDLEQFLEHEPLTAFLRWGRFMVTVTTPPVRSMSASPRGLLLLAPAGTRTRTLGRVGASRPGPPVARGVRLRRRPRRRPPAPRPETTSKRTTGACTPVATSHRSARARTRRCLAGVTASRAVPKRRPARLLTSQKTRVGWRRHTRSISPASQRQFRSSTS